MRWSGLWIALALGAGCAHGPGPDLSRPPQALAAERDALGQLEAPLDDPHLETNRLESIARLAHGLGDRAEVRQALGLSISRARLARALALASSSPAERKAGSRRYLRAQSRAVELAEELGHPDLVVWAIDFPVHEGTRHLEAFRRAALAMESYPNAITYQNALAAFPDDPSSRLAVGIIAKRGYLRTLALEDSELLPLGRAALPLVEHRALDAVGKDEHARAFDLAAILLRSAPSHVGARLAAMLDRGLESKVIQDRPHLLTDVLGAAFSRTIPLDEEGALARLDLRIFRGEASEPERIAFVLRAVQAFLPGDASVEGNRLLAHPRTSAEGKRILRTVLGLNALHEGEPERFLAVMAEQKDLYFYARAAGAMIERGVADRSLAAAAACVGRSLEDDVPHPPERDRLLTVVTNPEVSSKTRALAAKMIASADFELGEVAVACLDRGLDLGACKAVAQAASVLSRPSSGGSALADSLATATQYLPLRTTWLDAIEMASAAEVATIADHLAAAQLRPVAATPAFARASLVAAIARGAPNDVRAILVERQGGLSPRHRVGAELALLALEEDGASPAEVQGVFWFPPRFDELRLTDNFELDEEGRASLQRSYPGDHAVARMARATALQQRGAFSDAAEAYVALADRLQGDSAAELLARAVSARIAIEELDEADALAALAAELSRENRSLSFAQALLHEARERWSECLVGFEGALRAYPRNERAHEGYLRCFGHVHADAAGGARLTRFLESAADLDERMASVADRRAALGITTGAEIIRLQDALTDGAVAYAFARTGGGGSDLESRIAIWFAGRLYDTETASVAVAIAREAAEHLDRTDDPQFREEWAWFHFLAGNGSRAVAIAEASTDESEALWVAHPIRRLAQARDDGLIPHALALRIWKNHQDDGDDRLGMAEALQQAAPGAPGVFQFLCRTFVDADLPEAALRSCARAWSLGEVDEDLAAAASWLLVNRTAEAAAAGLSEASVFVDVDPAVSAKWGGAWEFNRGYWLAEQGRAQEAALAYRQAWARGFGIWASGLKDEHAARIGAHAGLLYRALIQRGDGHPSVALGIKAWRAFMAAELDVAEAYAASSVRLRPVEEKLELNTVADLTRDIAALARRDLSAKAIDADGIRRAASLINALDLAGGQAGLLDHPRSHLFEYVCVAAGSGFSGAPELARAERMIRRHPSNLSVVVDSSSNLLGAGQLELVRELVGPILARHPNEPRLAELRAAIGIKPDVTLPDWMADPTQFQGAWSAAEKEARSMEGLVRWANFEVGAEVFLPSVLTEDVSLPLRFKGEHELVVHGRSSPMVSPCESVGCFGEMDAAMVKLGFESVWKAPSSGARAFADGLYASKNRAMLVRVLPLGKRLYVFAAVASTAHFRELLPTIRVALDSFRPLSAVLSSERAEALRTAIGHSSIERRHRARWRALLDAPPDPDRCVLGPEGEGIEAWELGVLLADLYLAAETVGARKRIVACLSSAERESSALGLLALLDEDAELHAYGRKVARTHGHDVRRLAEETLFTGGDGPAGVTMDPRGLPAYGALEVLAALSSDAQKQFARSLAQSADRELHALGLVGEVLEAGVLPPAVLSADIRSAPPTIATLAAQGLGSDPTADGLVAVRARLEDAQLTSVDELRMAAGMVRVLASRLEAEDAALLSRVADRAAALDAKGGAAGAQIADLVSAHGRGRELLKRRSINPAAPKNRAESYAADWVRARVAQPNRPALEQGELAKRPLVELLRPGSWLIARIPQPSVAVSLVGQIFERMDFGDDSRGYWTRRLVKTLADDAGAELFSPQGGLDLDRPIECAQHGIDGTFVCTAYVRDAARVRSALARRGVGDRAGTAVALEAGRLALALPLAIPAAPVLFHDALFGTQHGASGVKLVGERVRTEQTIAGHRLERYVTVEVHEDEGAIVDHEHYLFAGDRLFIFGREWIAEEVLGHAPSPSESLAHYPPFVRAVKDWRARAAVEVALVVASPGRKNEPYVVSSAQLALDTDGASIEAIVPGGTGDDVRALKARLPEGAASSLAFSVLPAELELGPGSLELPEPSRYLGPLPPTWLAEGGAPVAFAWYVEPEERLWSRWVAVTKWSPAVANALRTRGVSTLTPGQITWEAELAYVRSGDVLIMSSSERLVREAMKVPVRVSAEGRYTLLAEVDAVRAAAAFEALASDVVLVGAQRTQANLMGRVLRVGRSFSATGRHDPAIGASRISARMQFGLRESSGANLPVVKSSRGLPQNGLDLPVEFREVAATDRVRFVFEVEDARAAARAFVGSWRTRVKKLDDAHLEVVVVAGRDAGPPFELTKEAELRNLAHEGRIHVDAKAIEWRAQRIKGDASSAESIAERVVKWVHGNIRYERTPEMLGAAEVLARGRGDCTELSLLTVTLLRALGVPANLREGFLADGRRMVAHAWVAFYDGRTWREVDPTLGAVSVGPGHVSASVADVIGQVALGRIRVSALEAVPVE